MKGHRHSEDGSVTKNIQTLEVFIIELNNMENKNTSQMVFEFS